MSRSKYDFLTPITKNLYLYARWKETNSGGSGEEPEQPTTVTATFDPNGGTLNGSSPKTCDINSGETSCTITSIPTASKSGYTFTGWGTSSTCTSGNKDDVSLSKDTTYYACYALITGGGNDNEDGGDNNIEDNPNTGNWLLYVMYLIGISSLGYGIYSSRKVLKLNNK